MAQGARPERVGEEIRQELGRLLTSEVHDPGIGFVTITRVRVSPDLQQARAYYTLMGDDRARADTQRALERAVPFLRRHIGRRVRLRRVPDLTFEIDAGVEHLERSERLLLEIAEERRSREASGPDERPGDAEPDDGGAKS
jgi:ribosome-binding factor A